MAKHSTDVDSQTALLSGEFVLTVYDSLNPNEGQFLHTPLFGKSSLLSMAVNATANVALAGAPAHAAPAGRDAALLRERAFGKQSYKITRYLYCTTQGFAWLPTTTTWIGYIAESSEEATEQLQRRDIVVALRGTMSTVDWFKNVAFQFSDFPYVQTPASGAKVHTGVLSIYTSTDSAASSSSFGKVSMRDQIFKELHRLLGAATADSNTLMPVRITVTGHSLGGALATLVACDVGCNIAAELPHVTVSAITFASPKVGNGAFKTNTEMHTAFIWRYRSIGDIVPFLPPSFPWPYEHVGTELILDWTPSPYVSISISSWFPFSISSHNLELHMHVLAAEISVYTSIDGLLPDLPAVAKGGDVIDFICRLPAWDEADHDLLTQELEDAKQILKDDQEALELFLKEVNYIAIIRGIASAAGRHIVKAGGSRRRVHDVSSEQESPFDKRDYSLLNKGGDILKAEYNVPATWLVHPFKDMARDTVSHQWLPRVDRPNDIPEPSNEEYN